MNQRTPTRFYEKQKNKFGSAEQELGTMDDIGIGIKEHKSKEVNQSKKPPAIEKQSLSSPAHK